MNSHTLPYSAVLFDLEGTLVDFQWNLNKAAEEILELLNRNGIDPDIFGPDPDYAHLFNTTGKVIDKWPSHAAQDLQKQLAVIYNKYDADALSRWQLYPDTHHTLDHLSRGGYRMGVVSNCGKLAVSQVLEKFKLTQYFELIISRDDVAMVKPAPEGLQAACKRLNLAPGKILFVGDSVNDMLPANAIEMPCSFLTGGESDITKKTPQFADFVISSLSGLLKILQ